MVRPSSMACLAILGRLNVPPFFQSLSDLLLRQPFLFRPVVVHLRRLPYLPTNSAGFTSEGFQSKFVIWSSGRKKFSGCRWHSRHQAILIGFASETTDM